MTRFTVLAGEFGAGPVVDAMDVSFMGNFREECNVRPERGDFITIKMSATDAEHAFVGSVALHDYFAERDQRGQA